MQLPAQFMPVRIIPRADGKTDKIPLSRMGTPADPTLPGNWMSEEDARALLPVIGGHTVGFVLTKNDPYVFVDLDGHFHRGTGATDAEQIQNGRWSDMAQQFVAAFQGCAMEVSTSGTGLHFLGRAHSADLHTLRNRIPGKGLEFYYHSRFIAFGPKGWHGDPNADVTGAILANIPQRVQGGDIELVDGPSPDWTGPTDDDVLIRQMLSSAPSLAAAFGQKAHPRDLWECNEAKLAQVFPSATDTFDRSLADAALMGHLAFWTGRDVARMDRLFRRSKLVRPKYLERPDNYARPTIIGAAQACKRVYSRQTVAAPTPTTTDAKKNFGEYLNVTEQREYFDGCVYVRKQHRVMIPGGELLEPAVFKTFFGGHEFQMQFDNTRPSRNAFEAFTENRAFHFPKAEDICFRPDLESGKLYGGRVNCYFPQVRELRTGDVTPFLNHLAKLIPNERDRTILLSAAAFIAQNPGKKLKWAPVIIGPEGNGKSLIMRAVAHAVGPKYSYFPNPEDLGNVFNVQFQNKLFIGVEEIHTEGRREVIDTLKSWITDSPKEVQPKGIDKYLIDNPTNWWFNSNHRDAIPKTESERRYAVFYTAQRNYEDIIRDGMGGRYFPQLFSWLENGGYDYVASYLMAYEIADAFNPETEMFRAPHTSTTAEAVTASLGRAEQEILEAVSSEAVGFRNGWISWHFLDRMFKERRFEKLSPQRRRTMLEAMGYVEVCRSSKVLITEGNSRPPLWVRKDLFRPGLTVDDYLTAQGPSHSQDMPPAAITIPTLQVIKGGI